MNQDTEASTEKIVNYKQKYNELVKKVNAKFFDLTAQIEKLQQENLKLKTELNKLKFNTNQENEITEPRITLMSQDEIDYNKYIN